MTLTTHGEHAEVIRRLRRAHGHLESIVKMLADDRECLQIAQQLQAVEKAIGNAKKLLVRDHIDHCLEHATRDGARNSRDTLREFHEITKYL